MGWLFAVSLGLQAQSSRAVVRARAAGPWSCARGRGGAGRAAALGGGIAGVQRQVDRRGGAAGFGALHFRAHAHSRWGGGMCVGPGRLTMWSFLVSSAHGAGAHGAAVRAACSFGDCERRAHVHSTTHAAHLAGIAMSAGQTTALLATLLHPQLRRRVRHDCVRRLPVPRPALPAQAWINMNVIWAVALIVTAVATPLV